MRVASSSHPVSGFPKLVCLLAIVAKFANPSSPIVVTPANPVAASGQSVTITSSVPVSWQLKGGGTIQNQTTTSVTFTAPQVAVKNPVLGCPATPNDSIFNTRVDRLPVDPQSAAYMAWANMAPLAMETDNWGISYADATTPTTAFKTYFGSAVYPNFVMPPPGPGLKRQAGNNVGTFGWTSNPDHHIVTVRRSDCGIYESYDDYRDGYVRTCWDGSAGCNVEGAIAYKSTDYAAVTSSVTNAAGLPLAATVWRLDEIKSGHINHAGYLTTFLGGVLANSVRWPATATAGGCTQSACPSALPMGARLRLSAGFNIAAVCHAGIPEQDSACVTLLTAMKEYGFLLSDTGSTNAVQTLSDVSEDTYVYGAIQAIGSAQIAMTNFEVVDESSLEVNAVSFATCPYGQSCLNGVNSYQQPQDQSVILATAADGSVVSTPVAIQGVGIGLGISSVMPIAAGSYNFQIPYWVNGTSDQIVNWTLQSGVGSVTASGLYTPPATLTGSLPQGAVLLGVSAANPNAVVQLNVNVLPTASSQAGSIRIDSGSPSSNTDTLGQNWLADIGVDGASNVVPGDWPNWNKANPAQTIVYQSAQISNGNDIGYNIIVPNGNYKIHLLFGQNSQGLCNNGCASWLNLPGTPWDQYSFGPYLLESQGQIQAHSFDFGAQSGYLFQTPVDAFIPAVANNNLLQIYVRGITHDVAPYMTPQSSDQHKIIELNGLEIEPDTTAPYWAIDSQNQTSITAGQTLATFYVVDWYTGRNDPSWSIVSGPAGASISATGVLTLSSGAQTSGQPIVVMASDGTYSATISIATPGTHSPALSVPSVTTSSSALQFGSQTVASTSAAQAVASTSAAQAVTLTNAGSGPVTFIRTVTGTNSGDFAIANSTCGSTLAAAATCSVSVSFTPTAAGSRSASLCVTDSAGNSLQTIALAGTGVAVPSTPPPASAAYVGLDITTQGTWTGKYGADGYMIANGAVSVPSYASVNVTGASTYTWASPTSDPRSPQTGPGATSRIASTYAGGNFAFQVNLNDGKTHQLALYLLAFDGSARADSISILDAVSGTTLDTRSFSSFVSGQYAVWSINGSVTVQVSTTCNINAVVAALFLDSPAPVNASAAYQGLDATTTGTWTGKYGADGYVIPNGITSVPSYATVAVTGDSLYTWASPTSDPRAPQTSPGATTRIASCYAGSDFSFQVNFTDGKSHQVALYLLDFDNSSRADNISVLDAASGKVLDTRSFSEFSGGQYASWNIQGNVIIQVSETSGIHSVVSGIFFAPAVVKPAGNSASYQGLDSTTQGSWTGKYGADGNMIANNPVSLPAYAGVTVSQAATTYTWESPTSDPRALQTSAGAATRIASTYAGSSYTYSLSIADGHVHQLALYLLDFDNSSRVDNISIVDAATGNVLDQRTFSGFASGQYAIWNVSGNVIIKVSENTGMHAVVAGLFFGQ